MSKVGILAAVLLVGAVVGILILGFVFAEKDVKKMSCKELTKDLIEFESRPELWVVSDKDVELAKDVKQMLTIKWEIMQRCM